MAVFVRPTLIFAVVEMHRLQPVQTDDLIEPRQNSIQIVQQIISGVPGVAGVEADADMVLAFEPVNNFSQFLKTSAEFRALSSHRLQQYRRSHLRPKQPVQIF